VPAGRPSKFSKEIKRQLEILASKGWTDEESAELLGITRQTLHNWRKSNKKFFDAIKAAKEAADKSVERSLYERACGYSCPETKPQWVQDKDGGRWEYAELVKHYPPDPTSMIFWLKNRQPERWRDKQDVEHSGGQSLNIQVEFVDAGADTSKT